MRQKTNLSARCLKDDAIQPCTLGVGSLGDVSEWGRRTSTQSLDQNHAILVFIMMASLRKAVGEGRSTLGRSYIFGRVWECLRYFEWFWFSWGLFDISGHDVLSRN
jgi:hypothetical protein